MKPLPMKAVFIQLCLLMLSTFSVSSSVAHGSSDEVIALLKWKASLQHQNNNSLLPSWISFLPNIQNYSSTKTLPLTSPCTWYGVSCNSDGSVIKLNLTSLGLNGTLYSFTFLSFPNLTHFQLSANNFFGIIPPGISNLSKLVYLDFVLNHFSGIIPPEIGLLENLETLHLFMNQLNGSIPHEICRIKFLYGLTLYVNNLMGAIPFCLGNLTNLRSLCLSDNKLFAPIPYELGNLLNLNELHLQNNFLNGPIPNTLGNLSKLTILNLFNNHIHGPIPPEIGSLRSLLWLNLCTNSLTGSIPSSLGHLRSLTEMHLYSNNLSGPIPEEFGNMTSIVILQVSFNQLSGSIPNSIGNLLYLESFHLRSNHFSGPLPQELGNLKFVELELSENNFSGSLPDPICNGGRLRIFLISQNKLTGTMPNSLYNCTRLTRVRLDGNKLTGNISGIFGAYPHLEYINLNDNKFYGELSDNWSKCKNLTAMQFGGNGISGSIPPSLGNYTQIQFLNLSFNHLVGEIPKEFGRMNRLVELFLSSNHLSGVIPLELGSLTKLSRLDLSMNNLDGPIPYTLGNCLDLKYLYIQNNKFNQAIPIQIGKLFHLSILDLSHNSLTSEIPSQIASLISLENLNLSHNQLSGYIPKSMEAMHALSSIDISYNDLQGPIPNSKGFLNTSLEHLQGNKGLCGNISGLQKCNNYLNEKGHNTKRFHELTLIVSFPLLGALLLLSIFIGLFILSNQKKRQSSTKQLVDELSSDFFSLLTFSGKEIYDQILQVTQEFNETFCIGQGRCGSVYKAELTSNEFVAVKRFHSSSDMVNRNSFINEVKALTEIRHRNIVNLYGYCSHEKHTFLIYEYLEGGDLFQILRNEVARILDWMKRVNIIKGVSHALSYIHHDCSPPIVHRDISSKNILLNSEYEACISDFGTSKILNPNSSNATAVAGTFGYLAPEFAYTIKLTEKCDVYSFGILTLEVIKGEHPGDMITSLSYEKMEVQDLLDNRLPYPSPEMMKVLTSIIILAIQCLNTNPDMRPTMYDVSQQISATCEAYL